MTRYLISPANGHRATAWTYSRELAELLVLKLELTTGLRWFISELIYKPSQTWPKRKNLHTNSASSA